MFRRRRKNMGISEKIRKFTTDKRIEKKMTYRELAEKADVSERILHYWEYRKRKPTDIEIIEKVLNALGYTLEISKKGETDEQSCLL